MLRHTGYMKDGFSLPGCLDTGDEVFLRRFQSWYEPSLLLSQEFLQWCRITMRRSPMGFQCANDVLQLYFLSLEKQTRFSRMQKSCRRDPFKSEIWMRSIWLLPHLGETAYHIISYISHGWVKDLKNRRGTAMVIRALGWLRSFVYSL